MRRIFPESSVNFLFIVVFLVPGLPLYLKYLKITGGLVCFLFFLVFLHWLLSSNILINLEERKLVIFFLFVATVLFFVIYPLAQSRSEAGVGSDRDEAISIAVRNLLDFQNPYSYSHPTYLGNPISSLPGSLLIHVPSQLIFNNTVYMEPILLILSILLLQKFDPIKCKYLIVGISISPVFWQDFLTGGDLAINAVLSYVLLLIYIKQIYERRLYAFTFAGIALGISLCSRLPMIFYLLPIVINHKFGTHLYQRIGKALLPMGIFGILILSFATLDFSNFTPIKTLGKSGGLSQSILTFILLLSYICVLLFESKDDEINEIRLESLLAPLGIILTVIPAVAYDFWSLYYSYIFGFLAFVSLSQSRTKRDIAHH